MRNTQEEWMEIIKRFKEQGISYFYEVGYGIFCETHEDSVKANQIISEVRSEFMQNITHTQG